MSVLTRELAVKRMGIGYNLPNGATTIDYAWDERYFDGSVLPGGYVLAMIAGSPDPYVTWMFSVHEDGNVVCSSGHYFDRLQPALDDFHRRTK